MIVKALASCCTRADSVITNNQVGLEESQHPRISTSTVISKEQPSLSNVDGKNTSYVQSTKYNAPPYKEGSNVNSLDIASNENNAKRESTDSGTFDRGAVSSDAVRVGENRSSARGNQSQRRSIFDIPGELRSVHKNSLNTRDSLRFLNHDTPTTHNDFFLTIVDEKEEKQTSGNNEPINDPVFNDLVDDSEGALKHLRDSWGVKVPALSLDLAQLISRSRLAGVPDAILVTQGWNKALAFRSMFAEALVGRWRVLCAVDEINSVNGLHRASVVKPGRPGSKSQKRRSSITHAPVGVSLADQALHRIERNADPIGNCFGQRIGDLETIIIGALDAAVRELCPHQQIVQREAYRALGGSADPDPRISQVYFHENECKTFDQFCSLFARYGIHPSYWVAFCDAFCWTMQSHNPYGNEEDKDDLEKPKSAYGRFVAGMVALPMIEADLRYASYVRKDKFRELKAVCSSSLLESRFEDIGMRAFNKLFENYPDLNNYFSESDVDTIAVELVAM